MKHFITRVLLTFSAAVLLSACGSSSSSDGGGGGGTPPPPADGSNWDEMVWGQDNWAQGRNIFFQISNIDRG